MLLQDSDAVLALRSKVKSGGWLRLAAKHAGVPVFSVKRGDQLENALRTLLGIYPAPGGAVLRPSAQQDITENASPQETTDEALLDIPSTPEAVSGGHNNVSLPGSSTWHAQSPPCCHLSLSCGMPACQAACQLHMSCPAASWPACMSLMTLLVEASLTARSPAAADDVGVSTLREAPLPLARQYGGVTSQREAESHSEALEEARIAVESIVLPRQQPIELMPRAEDVVEAQVWHMAC